MAFEDIKADIAMLFQRMVNQPEDVHQLAEEIREKLNTLRAEGMPLPEDLLLLEKQLTEEYGA
ncbi:MAG: hypothetical protein ABI398_01000 [Devosia sp.]